MTTIAEKGRSLVGYNLEHIFSFTGRGGAAPEAIGQLPEGLRVNFQNVGGEIHGPRLQGKLRAFGGDWVIVRKDGIAILDARVTLETDDGALIMATYPGTIDFGEDGYENFLRSNLPPTAQVRISPRFYTGHSNYLWLNRLHCLGIGEWIPAQRCVNYDIYAVR